MRIQNFYFILLFLFLLLSCEKGPYFTSADGYVVDQSDSSEISFATIRLMHWDGNEKHDTVFVMSSNCDTSGRFDFGFESKHKNESYWVIAAKEGYSNSSWGHLDIQWGNTYIIELDKE